MQLNLRKIENYSPREVFEYVKEHLLTQNKRSSSGSHCAYRDPEGLSCAIGCLIPDEEYDSSMDENSSYDLNLLIEKFYPDLNLSPKMFEVLLELQLLHDGWSPEYWEHRLTILERRLFPINLNNINDYSLLDILEFVKEHLLSQGKPSFNSGCSKYRDSEGNKCAIGCLILDKDYDPSMEPSLSISLNPSTPNPLNYLLREYYPEARITESRIKLLIKLQTIHDYENPFYWGDALNSLKNELENMDPFLKLRRNHGPVFKT